MMKLGKADSDFVRLGRLRKTKENCRLANESMFCWLLGMSEFNEALDARVDRFAGQPSGEER
jgi:hypothetical protein